jgi:hypothetical protein
MASKRTVIEAGCSFFRSNQNDIKVNIFTPPKSSRFFLYYALGGREGGREGGSGLSPWRQCFDQLDSLSVLYSELIKRHPCSLGVLNWVYLGLLFRFTNRWGYKQHKVKKIGL